MKLLPSTYRYVALRIVAVARILAPCSSRRVIPRTLSAPPRTVCVMAKFDPDRFQKMMAELNAEAGVIVRSPLEEFEPDFDYLPTTGEVFGGIAAE